MSKRKAEFQLTPVACSGRTSDQKLKAGIQITYNANDTYTIRLDDANNLPFWMETTFKIEKKEKELVECLRCERVDCRCEEPAKEEGEDQDLGSWIMHKGKIIPVTEVPDEDS